MILVVTELRRAEFAPVTRELVSFALRLGRDLEIPVAALVMGHEVDARAKEVASWQVARVLVADDPSLAGRVPEHLGGVLGAVIKKESPAFVIAGHTSESTEFIPRVAARLSAPLVPGCLGYERHGDRLLFARGVFNSKLHMRVTLRGSGPGFVTLGPGACPVGEIETGEGVAPEAIPVEPVGIAPGRRSLGVEESPKGEVRLESASTIVAVGRGIQKAENLGVVEELAAAFDAPLGASRPVVDAGWLPRDRQIGSSGQTVAPRLYVAVGISGAVQHLVGMQGSQCVVAINKDSEAPVFKVAHYGIVGDLFEVVPELTRLVRDLGAGAGAGN